MTVATRRLGAAGLGLVVVLGACGISAESSPRPVEGTLQFGLDQTTTSTTTTTIPITVTSTTSPPAPTTTTPAEVVQIYFVGSDGKLVPVQRTVPQGADLARILTQVQLDPTLAEEANGLRTAVPRGSVLGIQVVGGTATIDLAQSFLDAAPSPLEQQLAAGQLTMTVTERGPGVGRVRFTVGGSPIAVPRGDGSLPQEPDQSVSRDDYASIVASPPA